MQPADEPFKGIDEPRTGSVEVLIAVDEGNLSRLDCS